MQPEKIRKVSVPECLSIQTKLNSFITKLNTVPHMAKSQCPRMRLVTIPHCNLPQNHIVLKYLKREYASSY